LSGEGRKGEVFERWKMRRMKGEGKERRGNETKRNETK
jgi:hypothetical protein